MGVRSSGIIQGYRISKPDLGYRWDRGECCLGASRVSRSMSSMGRWKPYTDDSLEVESVCRDFGACVQSLHRVQIANGPDPNPVGGISDRNYGVTRTVDRSEKRSLCPSVGGKHSRMQAMSQVVELKAADVWETNRESRG